MSAKPTKNPTKKLRVVTVRLQGAFEALRAIEEAGRGEELRAALDAIGGRGATARIDVKAYDAIEGILQALPQVAFTRGCDPRTEPDCIGW